MQAYGWSLPANKPTSDSNPVIAPSSAGPSPVPVPVPVYCRPLMEKEPGMKIWCAAGVDMSGGRATTDADTEKDVGAIHSDPSSPDARNQNMSSLVWICTSTHAISKVTVIDGNSPADVLESFHVCSSHLLCISAVPGAKEDDFVVDEAQNRLAVEESERRQIVDDTDRKSNTEVGNDGQDGTSGGCIGAVSFVSGTGKTPAEKGGEKEAAGSGEDVEDTDAAHRRFLRDTKGTGDAAPDVEKMSSVLPTMWLGSQSGSIYVHSAVSQWKCCIHSIRLKDSVLAIVHVKGRVLATLANGTVAIFNRSTDGQWDLSNYHVLDLGRPHASIRCAIRVNDRVWCGYRNQVFVVDPCAMSVACAFDAHPRKESQVRQMAWSPSGNGVWISIRLDSTLRLYHAHTHAHLQDVDIEPYVSKMLGTGKLGFSFVRITSLLVSCNRLWMGTGNGVIISVPLAGNASSKADDGGEEKARKPGSVVRVYSDVKDHQPDDEKIPFCSMAQAQLSFHGHRDAVKFFVSVPGNGGLTTGISGASTESVETSAKKPMCDGGNPQSMLVMSGGEGYIDFRIGDIEPEEATTSRGERSHLVVWHVPSTTINNQEIVD